jgi:ATP-binding cassette subfamily F protein 3
VHGGRAKPYDGDLTEYRKLVLAADRPGAEQAASVREDAAEKAAARIKPALSKNALNALKKAVETAETDLARINQEIAKTEAALAAPDLYANGATRAETLIAARGALNPKLEAAEAAWLAAIEALEEATS